MKRYLIFFITLFCFFTVVKAEEIDLAENAKSAILIEASTGEVIYSKNENERRSPASMTKMMSLILIMEEIENNNLKLNEKIRISNNASSMGGSQIFLEENELIKVEDLIKGISMASANDAVVVLAERIAGSETTFVYKMNQKAKALGLKNTYFKNSTGLDIEGHYSSAKDMSIIAKELIKHKKILEYSSKYESYLREKSNKKFWLVNTNKLIKSYEGMDGLKTGYTKNAGYCLTSTAKRNNQRLISVIMGEETSKIRNKETEDLLNYGFNLYQTRTILKKGKVVYKYTNDKSNVIKTDVILKEDVNILEKKGHKRNNIKYKVKMFNKELPIKKGDTVGKIEIYENSKLINKKVLTVKKDIKKASIFRLYLNNIINFLVGNY